MSNTHTLFAGIPEPRIDKFIFASSDDEAQMIAAWLSSFEDNVQNIFDMILRAENYSQLFSDLEDIQNRLASRTIYEQTKSYLLRIAEYSVDDETSSVLIPMLEDLPVYQAYCDQTWPIDEKSYVVTGPVLMFIGAFEFTDPLFWIGVQSITTTQADQLTKLVMTLPDDVLPIAMHASRSTLYHLGNAIAQHPGQAVYPHLSKHTMESGLTSLAHATIPYHESDVYANLSTVAETDTKDLTKKVINTIADQLAKGELKSFKTENNDHEVIAIPCNQLDPELSNALYKLFGIDD
jgi:hypothetical protein